MENLILLIPLLPLAGFAASGLAGRRFSERAIALIACAGPALAFAVSLVLFLQVGLDGDPAARLAVSAGVWIAAGDLEVPFSFALDRLGGVMALVVTGVGTLIHIYSAGYMRGDPGYARYFAYLNLFMAAMLILVLSDTIVLLFLGWEGVGLCSYLLIGFWYKDLANTNAGIKAFVVNRIGDLAFLLGIFAVFTTFGTFELSAINSGAAAADPDAVFWIALALFAGATGKSAQIPLHVWLPDAMAGPTPVSALIHAATMVTSGVYLLARLAPLYSAAPDALAIVAVIGAMTALLGAWIAFSQTDIKKVLAYSTVSQLGYMFLAAGAGAFGAAIFHVVTHAFFKALLFLGAGAVIHSLHHEQDMRRMGGLARRIPQTFWLFVIGSLSLAGFPLLSGFWSKDEILHQVHTRAGGAWGWTALWIVGLGTALLTAFYSFRQVALVFLGEYRGAKPHASDASSAGHHGPALEQVEEAPLSMRIPLFVLAFLSIAGGFLGVSHFLAPEAGDHGAQGALGGLILGGALAVAGIGAAYFIYTRAPALVSRWTQANPAGRVLYRLSRGRLYADEIYDRLVVRPVGFVAEVLYYLVDRAIIDVVCVHGSAFYVRSIGRFLRKLQSGRVPAYAGWFVAGVAGILGATFWMMRW